MLFGLLVWITFTDLVGRFIYRLYLVNRISVSFSVVSWGHFYVCFTDHHPLQTSDRLVKNIVYLESEIRIFHTLNIRRKISYEVLNILTINRNISFVPTLKMDTTWIYRFMIILNSCWLVSFGCLICQSNFIKISLNSFEHIRIDNPYF